MSQTTSELYIGGQPPRDGKTNEWAQNVVENPMPISFKLLELSYLFPKIKDPSFNVT